MSYYSVICALAIIIHIIINHDYIDKVFKKEQITERYYRIYFEVVLSFYVTDMLWGIFNSKNNITLLYIDTVIYYIAMASTVVFWCRYVIAYLRLNNIVGKIFKIIVYSFWTCEILLLGVNHFFHIFFWFDENGAYHAYFFRYLLLIVLIIMFTVITLVSFVISVKSPVVKKRRNITIGLFSISMVVTVFVQILYPLQPLYTIGLMIGNCVLHVFILEDEKNEFRSRLKENSDIISNAGYGIWKIKKLPDGTRTMTVDDTMQQILGIQGMKLEPKDLYKYYRERIIDDIEEIENDDFKSMEEGKLRTRILAWNHATRGKIYLSLGGSSYMNEKGQIAISGYCGDVTQKHVEEKRLNESLENEKKVAEEARRLAENASKAKTSFLFNMSHDIRTPMNAIMGFTELLENNYEDKDKCLDYISKIKDSGHFLLTLIDNVLEMARIETGNAIIDESVCDMEKFIQSLHAVFEEQMKNKNIDFQIKADYTHRFLYGDDVKLREIFLNIVSNAYKYTMPGGRVSITVTEMPYEKKGFGNYHVVVEDTGIGMSKEFLPHLFDEFARESTYTANKIQGTGLGMAIVKQYVELMKGTIKVESELGRGTRFTIDIVHRFANDSEQLEKNIKKKSIKNLKGKRILLAEDNDINAEIAVELLKQYEIRVDRAEDGLICVDKLIKSEENYYDMILMDIQMPNLNGYDAAHKIRALEGTRKAEIPIIAMTANAFEEDKKNAYEAGMNGHLSKPIEIKKMIETISDFIN